ncbi:hypothetical protein LTR37_009408 [Vermiconidia calcicola]|uniref:Uncharacterized protein n=1 Tax=Vermiconidia calcicola TaxID=1690605 RepID=A0ACC3N7Z1_9PEZI|nr:hypothetical protein LTR37_009408 [Vermiconidia calcicola]
MAGEAPQSLVCHTVGYDFVTSSNQYFPCGTSEVNGAEAQTCCYGGDFCMEDGICHYTHSGVTNGTGYYMAGCTDPTWKDPACPKPCVSQYGADVIYDRTNEEWRCCYSDEDTLNCQEPSDGSVKAPAPADLSTLLQLSTPVPSEVATTGIGSISSARTPTISLGKTTSPPSASSSTASPTRSSSPPPVASSAQASSGGLSPAALAGISVAVVLVLALVFGGGYLFYRRSTRVHGVVETHKSGDDVDRNPYGSKYASRTTVNADPYGMPNSKYVSLSTPRSLGVREDAQTPPRPLPQRLGSHGMEPVVAPAASPGLSSKNGFDSEKHVYEQEDNGPFEMPYEGYELRSRRASAQEERLEQRPMSVQELEGTTMAPAELPAHPRTMSTGTSHRTSRTSLTRTSRHSSRSET